MSKPFKTGDIVRVKTMAEMPRNTPNYIGADVLKYGGLYGEVINVISIPDSSGWIYLVRIYGAQVAVMFAGDSVTAAETQVPTQLRLKYKEVRNVNG